jgi:hypothetical protein
VASEGGILQPFRAASVRFVVSLYADDVGIFVGPEVADMQAVCAILRAFGDATGCAPTLLGRRHSRLLARKSRLWQPLQSFPPRGGASHARTSACRSTTRVSRPSTSNR